MAKKNQELKIQRGEAQNSKIQKFKKTGKRKKERRDSESAPRSGISWSRMLGNSEGARKKANSTIFGRG